MTVTKALTCIACAIALLAVAGCRSKQETQNAAETQPVVTTPVKPPANGDWTTVVSATSDGGVMMGNPNAKVHLIEIGSLTCPHCREFEETAVTPLIEKYVRTGQVSYEFRNYIRDTFDLAATLIAHCNGPEGFFPLSRAMYKDQPNWEAKIQATPQAKLDKLQNLPTNQLALQAAKVPGLIDWAAARGLPAEKSTQCLTDEKTIQRFVDQSGSVTQTWPDFEGTPNFVINGKLNNQISTWSDLDAALHSALGG
jgi:protein-disulfide isomerase